MDIKQLVLDNQSQTIRKSNAYMNAYTSLYRETFGSTPNCAGCTFKKDFNKLRAYLANPNNLNKTSIKTKVMSTNKDAYIIKKQHQNDILTYIDDNGRPVRCFGHKATAEYIENYLSKGKKEELAKRKKMFTTQAEIDGVAKAKADKLEALRKAEEKKKEAARKAIQEQREAGLKAITGGEETPTPETPTPETPTPETPTPETPTPETPTPETPTPETPTPETPTPETPTPETPTPETPTPETPTPETPTPETGEPLYNANVIKFANRQKVDELLADNMLDPADYPELKDAKAKLVSLTK